MKVKLVTETKGVGELEDKNLEQLVAYMARVSNPKNQKNENIEGLLKFCTRHKHWSIFQMVDLGFEIETSRAIAAQILRHRSFHFQEYSQRYNNEMLEVELSEPRTQDPKNRQNSVDTFDAAYKEHYDARQIINWVRCLENYEEAVEQGVAKECARMLLPLGTRTRLYMKGTLRDWIHYLTVRTAHGTQAEHKDIALEIERIISERYPLVGKLIAHTKKVDQYAYEFSVKEEI